MLTGMIISTRVLRDVQTVLDLRLFQSSYSKRIARWCLEYYKNHEKAPGVHIEDIFKQWMEAGGDAQDDEGQLIGRLLQRISDDYDRANNFNEDYVLQVAEKFFQRLDLARLADDLQNLPEDEAIEILNSYRPKQIPSHSGISLLGDVRALRKAFEEDERPMMILPGALGEMVNGDLCRGSFISFMGREKIGKTWTLSEIGFWGAKSDLNVAFFQAGDMTENQQLRRAAIRVAGKSHKARYCGELLVPIYDCLWNQNDSCEKKDRACDLGLSVKVEAWSDILPHIAGYEEKKRFWEENDDGGYVPCDFCRRRETASWKGALWYRKHDTGPPLTWREGIKLNEKFLKRLRGREIKLATYPNDTLKPSMIMTQLDAWANWEGFVPDIVVIDYADILLPDDTRMEFRHQQNSVWKALRRISQEYSCLVVTATQADAASYNQDTIDLSNFSEDKRKYSHVTSMYSLNQNYVEKVAGIMRMATMITRDEDYNSHRQAKVLQCLQMGRPIIGSFF